MTIFDLYEKCREQVELGNGDKPVYFDTEAVCFDCHMVPVKDAFYEEDMVGIDMMIMYYDFKDALYHDNRGSLDHIDDPVDNVGEWDDEGLNEYS